VVINTVSNVFAYTDTGNQVVRAITTGAILAGLNSSRPLGEPTLAQSLLFSPTAVATGGSNVYIAGAHLCAEQQSRERRAAALCLCHAMPSWLNCAAADTYPAASVGMRGLPAVSVPGVAQPLACPVSHACVAVDVRIESSLTLSP
jgi:hypothetical protein